MASNKPETRTSIAVNRWSRHARSRRATPASAQEDWSLTGGWPLLKLWDDLRFCTLPLEARYVYVGLIDHADDYGNVSGEATFIKKKFLATDAWDLAAIDGIIDKVELVGLAQKYDGDDGARYLHLEMAPQSKSPKKVSCPLHPSQEERVWKGVVKTSRPTEVAPDLREPFDTFIAMIAENNRSGKITDSRIKSLEAELLSVVGEYTVPATIFGIREAIKRGAASINYVKACARSYAQQHANDSRLPAQEDVRDRSLTELRRGVARR